MSVNKSTDKHFCLSVLFYFAKKEVLKLIGSSENSVSYNGNGISTAFPFSFKILEKSDLKLLLVDGEGEKLLTSDYFVDLNSSVVHYPGYSPGAEPPIEEQPPKLAEGQRLVIYRDVPITQETALDEHWPFNVIEGMADKLTIIAQQIAAANQRTFQLSIALSNVEDVNTVLPYAPGKAFAWNADGTGLEAVENPAALLPSVVAEVEALKEFVIEKQKEIDTIVETLDSLTLESITEVRDQAIEAARIAEEAARNTTNIVFGSVRNRATWKNNYGVQNL